MSTSNYANTSLQERLEVCVSISFEGCRSSLEANWHVIAFQEYQNKTESGVPSILPLHPDLMELCLGVRRREILGAP